MHLCIISYTEKNSAKLVFTLCTSVTFLNEKWKSNQITRFYMEVELKFRAVVAVAVEIFCDNAILPKMFSTI